MRKIIFSLIAVLTVAACSDKGSGNEVVNNSEAIEAVDNVIMSRRSIRSYSDKEISRETFDAILKAGINAPNGQNRQAYEIRVVDNPKLVQEISDVVVNTATDKQPQRRNAKNIFVNAPYVIFIAADRSYDMSQVDCGLLGENIMLAAWARGIGTCCLAAPVRQMKSTPACEPYIERLGFSAGYELLYAIAIGYPDETPDARPRKDDKIKYVE